MTKRMLIDGAHNEETRIAVVEGNYLEDFDFENAAKKQLKGNIYLAKVTRVEPSLQAAFVDYGGNRHGFLPFSEIHPDYYRIPVADREAMLKAEREAADEARKAEEAAEEEAAKAVEKAEKSVKSKSKIDDDNDEIEDELENSKDIEDIGGEDATDVAAETRQTKKPRQRRYKIQEVIQRRQVMLIQVSKEERGNKGAALTTYLSLPGRYCVLMPNSPRGGGISRKINSPKDRKRMKSVLAHLEMLEGMSVILRTAGVSRTKTEIRRDFDYLRRLWDNIRELTLKSSAPSMVYEEGNLVKRAIRDLYSRDIDEVLVAGEGRYREAKEYMKMFMPSHARKVQPYKNTTIPLFFRYQAESQIDAIHSTNVEMKSGGYIVIDQTEALVAIDVNSGRSTGKRSIEETALHTNLEAAEEVARQLRLRDLAGLVVIDFIDMDEYRNNHAVERKLKDALKRDRARIQVGRISPFGLMEMSRQRLRPSLSETSFESCPTCGGAGVRRSIDSTALYILRALEEEGIKQPSAEIKLVTSSDVALFILNNKRDSLSKIEKNYNFKIILTPDEAITRPDFRIERSRLAPELVNNAITTVELIEESSPKKKKDKPQKAKTKRTRRRGGRRHNKNNKATEAEAGAQSELDLDAKKEDDSKDKTKSKSKSETEPKLDAKKVTKEDTENKKTKPKRRRRSRRKSAKNADVANKADNAKAEAKKESPIDAQIGAISDIKKAEAKTETKAEIKDDKSGDAKEEKKTKRTRRSRRGRRKKAVSSDATIVETKEVKDTPEAKKSSKSPKDDAVDNTETSSDEKVKAKSRRGRRGGRRRSTRRKKTSPQASTEEPAPAPIGKIEPKSEPEPAALAAIDSVKNPLDNEPIFIEDTAVLSPSHDDISLPSDENFTTDENGNYDAAIDRTLEANAFNNGHAEKIDDDYNPIFEDNGFDEDYEEVFEANTDNALDDEPDLDGEAEYNEEVSLGDGSDYADEAEAYLSSMMAEDDGMGLDDDFDSDDEDEGESDSEWDDYSEFIEEDETVETTSRPAKKSWLSRLLPKN